MKIWLALGAVALVAAGCLIWGLGGKPAVADETPAPSVAVSTMRLAPGSLPATVTAYGSIGAAPGADRMISLQAGGVLTALSAQPGAPVTVGQVLAVIGADPQSRADLQRARNAVAAAQAARTHVAALLATHLATSADLAAATQTLDDATATLTALRAMGTGTGLTLKAPFAGVVSAVLAAPGTLLAPGAPLLRITDTAALVALVGIVPGPAVQPGDAARLTLLDTGITLTGTVETAAALRDPQSGLQTITIPLTAPAAIGEPVRAAITIGTLTGFVVPRDAVQNDEQGDYIFQIDPQNIAHRAAVHVLGSEAGQIVLASGLNTAMPVVTTGAYQLDDGTATRPGQAP